MQWIRKSYTSGTRMLHSNDPLRRNVAHILPTTHLASHTQKTPGPTPPAPPKEIPNCLVRFHPTNTYAVNPLNPGDQHNPSTNAHKLLNPKTHLQATPPPTTCKTFTSQTPPTNPTRDTEQFLPNITKQRGDNQNNRTSIWVKTKHLV